MKKVLGLILILGVLLTSCSAIKEKLSKDMVLSASKVLTEETLRALFKTDSINFELKTVTIKEAMLNKKHVYKVLGQKGARFLTEEGEVLFKTKKVFFRLYWLPVNDSIRNVSLYYRKYE